MQSGLVNPLAVKAVLMNGAEPWDSHDTPVPDVALADCGKVDVNSVHGPAKRFVTADRQYGRGYLNAARALAAAKHVVLDTLGAGERRCFALTGEGSWKLTLTWGMQKMSVARPARLTLRDRISGTAAVMGHPLDTTLQLGLKGKRTAGTSSVASTAKSPAAVIEVSQRGAESSETSVVFALAASAPVQRLARCP